MAGVEKRFVIIITEQVHWHAWRPAGNRQDGATGDLLNLFKGCNQNSSVGI